MANLFSSCIIVPLCQLEMCPKFLTISFIFYLGVGEKLVAMIPVLARAENASQIFRMVEVETGMSLRSTVLQVRLSSSFFLNWEFIWNTNYFYYAFVWLFP